VAQGAYTGGSQFFMTYTNQDGVSGKRSQICTSNTAGTAGNLISGGVAAGQFGFFMPLAIGDYGIQSVESFQFLGANGGIFALVLCKDLGAVSVLEATTTAPPARKDFVLDNVFNAPRIYDGAYINYLALPAGSLAAVPIYGFQTFIWG